SRALDVALAVEAPVPEGGDGLPLRSCECVVELFRAADDTHPAPASAAGCLDDERKTDLVGGAVGQHRNIRLAGDTLRRQLVAPEPERLRGRPDPAQSG